MSSDPSSKRETRRSSWSRSRRASAAGFWRRSRFLTSSSIRTTGGASAGWGDVELELKAKIPGAWNGLELARGVEASFLTGDEAAAAVDLRLLALNGEFERGDGPAWTIVPGFELRFDEVQGGVGAPVGPSDEVEGWGVLVDVELEF